MDLFTQRHPYTDQDRAEFDPNLGKHDGFLLLGPYIFAQVISNYNDVMSYVSHCNDVMSYVHYCVS